MKPKIHSATEHGISHDQINADALYVIHRLKEEGHEAYLVGGGVRDLLAGLQPKDFDISTSALPEEVKRIFRRRCMLIGRRFRLAHVRCGQHVLEVSTFRAGDTEEADLIVRDNTWGDAEQDALRRDFTINGLFYDPEDETIIDYVGGLPDIEKGVLRTIGNASARFCQDPVRMIRLIKFQARFGYKIDKEAANALKSCANEIVKSSPARILEEIFRMLESGAAEPFFRAMQKHGFLEQLLPWLSSFLATEAGERVYELLGAVDRLHKSEERTAPFPRPVLGCCLTYPLLEKEFTHHFGGDDGMPHMGHVIDLSLNILDIVVQNSFSSFPRRIRACMHYVMSTQFRMTPPFKTRVRRDRVASQKDFPLALDFLRIRREIDEELEEEFVTWKERMKSRKPTRSSSTGAKRPRRRSRRA